MTFMDETFIFKRIFRTKTRDGKKLQQCLAILLGMQGEFLTNYDEDKSVFLGQDQVRARLLKLQKRDSSSLPLGDTYQVLPSQDKAPPDLTFLGMVWRVMTLIPGGSTGTTAECQDKCHSHCLPHQPHYLPVCLLSSLMIPPQPVRQQH